jgi:hypothetical protein
MKKNIGFFFILLCIAAIFVAGCAKTDGTNATPEATPTPQIVYVTVLVTPTPAVTPEIPTVEPEITESAMDREVQRDEEFLEYVDGNRIFEGMTALEASSAGSYSINTGYNAAPKKEAIRLTELMTDAPLPGSKKMGEYRAALMNALAEMDGTTAGFTRYRDAMQTVILAKNAALSEMHALGSSSVDAMYFKGHGNNVLSFNITETGMKIFTLHHNGDRNFAVTLKNEDGKYISLLANELGDYSGKKTERLAVGKYYFEITADGDWTVGITSE